jgi:multisubunit Na+/H+ antiporter MnhC subunit
MSDTPQTPVPPAEPGYTTTEFWVTLFTLVMPAVTLIFHRDFSAQVQTFAVAAAGVAAAIYSLARAVRKSASDKSAAYAVASLPNPQSATPRTSPLTQNGTSLDPHDASRRSGVVVTLPVDAPSTTVTVSSDGTAAGSQALDAIGGPQ